jgi:hypothetical protein
LGGDEDFIDDFGLKIRRKETFGRPRYRSEIAIVFLSFYGLGLVACTISALVFESVDPYTYDRTP